MAATSRRRGRPVLGAFSGLVFGLFLGLDLWLLGQVRLDSPMLTALPVAGLALGLALGVWAPFGRGGSGRDAQPGGGAA